MSTEVNPKAYPLADTELTTTIINLINQASNYRLVKTGANEATKALNRNKAALVIMSADVDPIEIVLHLPVLCEDKNVPYVFIPSQIALGRAAGVSRAVGAVAVLEKEDSQLAPTIRAINQSIDKLLV